MFPSCSFARTVPTIQPMTDRKLTPATRDDLIHAIKHGMLFDGRKRAHHWDNINAQVAAEKLVDHLAKSNFVVMRGPPLPAHSADTSYKPPSGPCV